MTNDQLAPIPLMDTKKQYQALKTSIDSRIQKVLDHGLFINGPEVTELEKKLAEYVGVKHALAVASGTDALLMPMMGLNIGAGDEVITTSFSFIATAETIVLAGATPVYVDIDPVTYNINPTEIEKAITPKTKAIMPVSLYGQMADFSAINAIAKKHNLVVIEDSAQSFGAKQKGQRSGSVCLASGTSFYPAKPLGCYGDGGAIFTNDSELNTKLRQIRDHGSESKYYHTRLGLNGRLDTIQCAILLAKMERYAWELEQRDRIGQTYNKAFAGVQKPDFRIPVVIEGNFSAWAQYTLWVPNRADFQAKLQAVGIPTSVHYPRTMPDQPWYKENGGRVVGSLSVARKAAEHVVSLPLYPDMSEDIQQRIISEVLKAV